MNIIFLATFQMSTTYDGNEYVRARRLSWSVDYSNRTFVRWTYMHNTNTPWKLHDHNARWCNTVVIMKEWAHFYDGNGSERILASVSIPNVKQSNDRRKIQTKLIICKLWHYQHRNHTSKAQRGSYLVKIYAEEGLQTNFSFIQQSANSYLHINAP